MLEKIQESISALRERLSTAAPDGGWLRGVGGALGVYLLVALVLGMYWSIAPSEFDVQEHAGQFAAENSSQVVTGTVTTTALIGVAETLLDKPGGFLRNDVFPPGLWLDNMPNWEYGALIQVRDLARAMRESYSRSQSQSKEDPDLAKAEPLFNFKADSWMLPASEREYRAGIRHLESFALRLADPASRDAQFFARADNLAYWLATVETRLGSLSQRLTASVGQRRINTDLAGDSQATQATPAPDDSVVRTPWLEIDDVFYNARGSTWALIHFLRAAEVDFAQVLEDKNARVSLQQIIRELEATQQTVWSPIVLNGSGFGLVANHSLVMASYISRANAAIIDLRRLLSDG
ncbi:MAG: DUF2333 family protein [Halieaceae bacterium]|nr:DUF2333 family protein [Halieaceae bacterium]